MTRFTVNGNPVHYQLPPDTPLLWALRDASNLTGTKYGCGIGLCGACTVHIDGVAQRSCQVLIGDIEGTFVTTIEGLSDDRSHPVQQAWIAEQVPQCGYCQPGMIMAAAAFLKDNPSPSDEEVKTGITNLCRCGTYPRIRRAVLRAATAMQSGVSDTVVPPPGTTPEQASRSVPAMVGRTTPDED
jgi:isoquinoline 1-oxidoreductase alpha subunit